MVVALPAKPLQDRRSEFVAVDRLRQVDVKTRSERALSLRAGRDQGDRRHRPSQANVEVLELRDELAPGGLRGCEVAHDDVGGERDSKGVGDTSGGDERAQELEDRPKEMARELVVIDHQDMDSAQFLGQWVHQGQGPLSMSHRHLAHNSKPEIGRADG